MERTGIARARIALALVLEDVNRMWHDFARATGERRRWILAEIRIHLGRLNAADPRVQAHLAEVERIEIAEVQP